MSAPVRLDQRWLSFGHLKEWPQGGLDEGDVMSGLVRCGASLGLSITRLVCIRRGGGGQVWDSERRKALVHNRGPWGHFMDQRDPEIIK